MKLYNCKATNDVLGVSSCISNFQSNLCVKSRIFREIGVGM